MEELQGQTEKEQGVKSFWHKRGKIKAFKNISLNEYLLSLSYL